MNRPSLLYSAPSSGRSPSFFGRRSQTTSISRRLPLGLEPGQLGQAAGPAVGGHGERRADLVDGAALVLVAHALHRAVLLDQLLDVGVEGEEKCG